MFNTRARTPAAEGAAIVGGGDRVAGSSLRSTPARAIPRALLAGTSAYVLAYGAWQLFRWGGSGHTAEIGDAAFVPLTLVAIAAAWRAATRAGERRTASAWRLIALALVAYLGGDVVQLLYERTGKLPAASLADPFYLSFYPLFLAGLLRFPLGRTTRRARARLLLDTVTVTLGGSCVVWYLVLGPTATDGARDALENVVSTAYPAGDFMLIAGLTHLLLRTERSARGPFWLLASGVLAYLVADVTSARLELTASYSGGEPIDTLWLLATALFAFAAARQPRVVKDAASPHESAGEDVGDRDVEAGWSWPLATLPYAAVIVVFALQISSETGDKFFPNLSLTITAGVVAALVLLRQFLAQGELVDLHNDLRVAHARLASVATTDPLTRLPNHRALAEAIDTELERSARHDRTCALLFIDIDYFKGLNDTCGHAAGDAALDEIGRVMRELLRGIDTLGRWGGEEFVALLPESDPESAMLTAERIRRGVAMHRFEVDGHGHVTVSVGVSVFPRDGVHRSELLEAADRAMYTAKRMGRNQSLSATDPVVTALGSRDDLLSAMDDRAMASAVDALASLVDARDDGAARHNEQVASLAQQVALALGCNAEQARRTFLAARLHDVGKVAVADSILRKPDRLTDGEWALMQRHPVVGADVVGRMGSLAPLAEIIRSHHEHFDGAGYPDGLKGEEIPLEARIVGVADAFDAMVNDRPYRKRLDERAARAELRSCAGTQFDPNVVAALERVLDDRREPTAAAIRPPALVAR